MSDLVVRMEGVNMHYPHFDLKDVNLTFNRGSILGLIGPNGAGKSTTIRAMMGLLYPDAGTVEVLGHDMRTEASLARWKIGYASEDMRLYKKMTIAWHMNFIKSIFKDWDEEYANDLLKKFNLVKSQKIKGLSHGQRVKASLLLILARRPDLLILDEPTTGLDPVARKETLNEMMEVLMDDDRSIVFSSHNTTDVEQLSDQITFIDNGKVVSSRDKESYLESWRRVRLILTENNQVPELNKVIEQSVSGRSAVITTNEFTDDLLTVWTEKGVEVSSVESMTLEEIFLAEVNQSRKLTGQKEITYA